MTTTIDDRVYLLLEDFASLTPGLAGHGVWKRLGQQTGIPAQRWRNVMTGRQKATTEMVEALCKTWPSYAFWLVTGITDAANGHRAPCSVVTFPERLQDEDCYSEPYFMASIKLLEKLYLQSGIDLTNPESRRKASSKLQQLTAHAESSLMTAIRQISGGEEYADLIKGREAREQSRARNGRERVARSHSPM